MFTYNHKLINNNGGGIIHAIVRVFDFSLNFIAEIDDYTDLIFIRRWHRAGEFTLVTNYNKLYSDQLIENRIIFVNQHNIAGIILQRELDIDAKGNSIIKIRGTALKGMSKRRITIPPTGQATHSFNTNTETIMKNLVTTNFASGTDRQCLVLNITNNQNRGQTVPLATRYKELHEELRKLSRQTGVGWDFTVNLNTRMIDFEIYEGVNRTAGQSVNSRVIFSIDYDSVRNQKYISSDINTLNFAYVGGQGEGAARTIREVGTTTGIGRIETFVDARDISDNSELDTRGQQRLDENSTVSSFDGQITEFGTFQYLRDWDLGDIVTVQNPRWAVTLDSRITEVKLVWNKQGFRVTPIFNNKLPEIIDIINQNADLPVV